MIYAIEAIGLDRVKIGRSRNPRSRLDALRTGSPVPLQLIISEPWDDSHEALIHNAFSEYRIFGEWFHAGPRLVKFLHAMGQPGDTTEEKYENAMSILGKQTPKCPKCGKTHYSTQRCSAEEALSGRKAKSPSTSVVFVDESSPDNPVPSNVESACSPGNVRPGIVRTSTTPNVPNVGTSTSGGPTTNEVHRESSSGDQDAPVSGETAEKQPEGSAIGIVTPGQDQSGKSASVASGSPLTPAAKQKAYRKRLKDDPGAYEAYLEANKLRMRKKRDG